jgi:phospholipase C
VFEFDRLGLRVPAVIASPWIAKGTVYKKQLQHTSVMQTAREIFGIKAALTKRDAAAASFSDVFSLTTPRTDAPVKLQRPALAPEPLESSPFHPGNKSLDPIQRDIVMGVNHNTRTTQHNNPPAELLPRIQVKASEFVIQKTKAHFAKLPGRKVQQRGRSAYHA